MINYFGPKTGEWNGFCSGEALILSLTPSRLSPLSLGLPEIYFQSFRFSDDASGSLSRIEIDSVGDESRFRITGYFLDIIKFLNDI